MKLKVQSNADSGAVYVAAIDDETGEHRATATLNKGEEVELNVPGVDVSSVEFGATTGDVDEAKASAEPDGGTPEAVPEPDNDEPAGGTPAEGTPAQSPTIGRIVTYRSSPTVDYPAIVTAVEEGEGFPLTLTVFEVAGPFVVFGCLETVGDEPAAGTWRWPSAGVAR
jgi:hypothetical protein